MLRKLSILFLTLMMTLSIFTVNTFAEDEGKPEGHFEDAQAQVETGFENKADDVKDSLVHAAIEEGKTAIVDVIHGDFSDAKDEIVAAANELLAKDAVEVAETIVDKKLDEIAQDAINAQEHALEAKEAKEDADKALGVILDENTIDKNTVEKNVDIIYKDALAATVARNEAFLDYAKAERDYSVMVAETEAALMAGLIDATEAAMKTEAVKKELEIKKDIAENLSSIYNDSVEDIQKEIDDAKANLDKAGEDLKEAAAGIVVNAATAAVSEGVVLAADAAIAITQSTINNLEREIAGTEEQLALARSNLAEAILNIDQELVNANINYYQDKDGYASVETLKNTRERLVAAQDALNKAEKLNAIAQVATTGETAHADSQAIIDAYNTYQSSLTSMKGNTSENPNLDNDVIAKYVLTNVSDIEESQIEVLTNGIVKVTNKDNTVEFFKIDLEGDQASLKNQVYKVGILEQKILAETDEEGNELYYYTYKSWGRTYKEYVTLDKFNDNGKAVDLNSTIENASANVDNAKANLSKSEANYIDSLYTAQETVNNFADKYEAINEKLEKSNVKELVETLNDLDRNLNGGLVDKLIRISLTNDAVMDFLKNPNFVTGATALAKGGQEVVGVMGEYGISGTINEIKNGNNEAGTLFDLISQIGKVSTGEADAQKIIEDISKLATSNAISEETKKAFAELIRDAAKSVRDDAITALDNNVQKAGNATSEIVKSAGEIASATTKLAVKEALKANGGVIGAITEARAQELNRLYEQAVKADAAADAALAKYWDLMLHPEIDRTSVEEAKNAWLNASEAARQTWDDYRVAKNVYDNVYGKNQNQGTSNGQIQFDGYNEDNRYDIIANPLSPRVLRWYASSLKVNPDDVRTFVVEAFVAENGLRFTWDAMELNNSVSFKVTLPDAMRNAPYLPGCNARVYDVTRWHDYNDDKKVQENELEVIATGLRPNEAGELTITSDKFSFFIITARDYHIDYSYTVNEATPYKAVVKTSNK